MECWVYGRWAGNHAGAGAELSCHRPRCVRMACCFIRHIKCYICYWWIESSHTADFSFRSPAEGVTIILKLFYIIALFGLIISFVGQLISRPWLSHFHRFVIDSALSQSILPNGFWNFCKFPLIFVVILTTQEFMITFEFRSGSGAGRTALVPSTTPSLTPRRKRNARLTRQTKKLNFPRT